MEYYVTLFVCDIIKCAVNMKFGRYYYLKEVNNKSIMFKQLITVGIWKCCVVGNLSDEIYSISAVYLGMCKQVLSLYWENSQEN